MSADAKIVIIGESGVGKTSILNRFVHGEFGTVKATIGVSFVLKEWKGTHLAIWDTAGQEKYAPLSNFYSRDAAAAIIVYDITDRNSFDNLEKYWGCLENAKDNCVVVVVGNKYDLPEDGKVKGMVSAEEGRDLALKKKAHKFFEASALTNMNIDAIFDSVCKGVLPEKFCQTASSSSVKSHIRLSQSAGSSSEGGGGGGGTAAGGCCSSA